MKFAMVNNMRTYLILFAAGLTFNSCKSKNDNSKENNFPSKVHLVRDIYGGENSFVYNVTRILTGKLKLENIDSGFNGLQIRVWYSQSFNDTSQLLVLKRMSDKWAGQIFTYVLQRDKKTSKLIDSIVYVSSPIAPKSGWKNIYGDLKRLKIMDLADMSALSGNGVDILDGNGVSVEISNEEKYRFYSYTSPTSFADRWWQANNIDEFLNITQSEFDFPSYQYYGRQF
ncbi:MAG: hypothetical protein ABWZ25_11375 [Chitinophagaceae bacterium]